MITRAIAVMQEFLEAYQALGDPRAFAYATAIDELRKHQASTIESFLANEHPGIGPKMRQKLIAIQSMAPLPKLTRLRKQAAALTALQKILGVGVETSREWARQGAYDVASVRKLVAMGKITLTDMQRNGLEHYDDLHARIPRKEVGEIASYVAAQLKITAYDIAGSYRRGAASSGDVDIIVRGTATDATIPGVITLTRGSDRVSFLIKWQKWRQVDILYCSNDAYPYALLYFTGSYEFNIAMRARAHMLGYTLNQKELSGWRGVAETEKDIFDALGLVYVEPCNRKDASSLHQV